MKTESSKSLEDIILNFLGLSVVAIPSLVTAFFIYYGIASTPVYRGTKILNDSTKVEYHSSRFNQSFEIENKKRD